MLRVYFVQQWFNLSDPAVDDSRAMRGFVGVDLGREPVSDETTVCKFRHRLEAHIGADSKTKLIHTVVTTPANVHDSQVLGELLHRGSSNYSATPPAVDSAR